MFIYLFVYFLLSLFPDGDPIKLPDNLESLPRADSFPSQRHRWNTNEVSLICFLFSIDFRFIFQSRHFEYLHFI